MSEINLSSIWERIREELKDKGIDFDAGCCEAEPGSPLRVVCMAGGLSDSLKEMGQTTRDQVVMVRVDEETSKKLDHWVETGAFKSRSEAAALFMREGLKVHARGLDQLDDALSGVEEAKERLRQRVRQVFESEKESESNGDDN
jgi:Arc/MetJ-type ribon-helix-helix transcriptional regulator